MSSGKPVTVLGIPFPSHKSACRFWDQHPKTVRDRLKSGWPVDEAYLLRPDLANSQRYRPKHQEFVAINPEVSRSTYLSRVQSGLSDFEAQSLPLGYRKPKYVIGDESFTSMIDACEKFGASFNHVKAWMSYGLSFEDAVLAPPLMRIGWADRTFCVVAGVRRTVTDHCRYYDVTVGAVMQRVKRGMSLPQAITAPNMREWETSDFSLYVMTCSYTLMSYVGITEKPETRLLTHWKNRNHRKVGNKPLYAAMRRYGLPSFSFDVIEKFDDVDEMREAERLTISERGTIWPNGYNLSSGGEYFASHIAGYELFGVTYRNKDHALETFDISDELVKSRLGNGWSEWEAWTMPVGYRRPKHELFGKKYASLHEVADEFGISHGAMYYRLKRWGTLEKAVMAGGKK